MNGIISINCIPNAIHKELLSSHEKNNLYKCFTPTSINPYNIKLEETYHVVYYACTTFLLSVAIETLNPLLNIPIY